MLASPLRPTASGNSLSRRREVAEDTIFIKGPLCLATRRNRAMRPGLSGCSLSC
jgi:hypothetical protein